MQNPTQSPNRLRLLLGLILCLCALLLISRAEVRQALQRAFVRPAAVTVLKPVAAPRAAALPFQAGGGAFDLPQTVVAGGGGDAGGGNFQMQSTSGQPLTGVSTGGGFTYESGFWPGGASAPPCPTIALSPATLPSPIIGQPYNQTLTAGGGTAPYSFALTNGVLPDGVTLSAAGLLSGAANTFFSLPNSITITATDADNCTGAQTYTFDVVCPALTLAPPTVPGGFVGEPYSVQFSAGGGAAPYSYSVAGGGLPPGVTLNETTGLLSGTPTTTGVFNFSINALDLRECNVQRAYSISVVCPTITVGPQTLPNKVVGEVVTNLSVNATGGSAPYSFALTGGTLPTGLTLAANGAINGTVTAAPGTFSFTITAIDARGCTGTRFYSLTINPAACPTISVNPDALPAGTYGAAYSQTITATPGGGGYTFAVTSGALPLGLSLNASSGAITGTPIANGTFIFTITATTQNNCAGSRTYTITVGCAAITLTALPFPDGTAGSPYSRTVTATPAGNYTYTLSQGNLPTGLTLNPSGVVSGLPSVVKVTSFRIRATDVNTNFCHGEQAYTLAINCPTISLSALPTPALNTVYNQSLTATPAGGNYSYTVTGGSLPPGLILNSATGSLSGTTATAGTFNFTITAMGWGVCSGSREYSFALGGCPTISLPDLPSGAPGQLYNHSVAASPVGGYSYAVTAGSLPPGLTLYGSFGLILGYPTAAGAFNFTIAATDANNCVGSKQYSLAIGGAASRSSVFGDFDGDGKTDLSVWRGQSGEWLTIRSSDGKLQSQSFGSTAAPNFDVLTPGDYDGDGRMDNAVFRRGTGEWIIKGSQTGTITTKAWGLRTDIPVPGDYDGDGKTDIAVWRGAETNWYILFSDGQTRTVSWGTSNAPYRDLPVAADFDGDGKTDVAVFRQSNGHWYIKQSSDGAVIDKWWGLGTDTPVAADYDGDGKADIAVWRSAEGNWYIVRSSDGATQSVFWGTSSLGDVAAPADYDGDGKTDVAVWRASLGIWYIVPSSNRSLPAKTHGQQGDLPVILPNLPAGHI